MSHYNKPRYYYKNLQKPNFKEGMRPPKFQKCSSCRKLLLFYHCSRCYCLRAKGIVSVVCSIVLSKGSKTLRELLHDPRVCNVDAILSAIAKKQTNRCFNRNINHYTTISLSQCQTTVNGGFQVQVS